MRQPVLLFLAIFWVLYSCEEKEQTFTNALAGETSPYLLQHAHNPVDWQPWSDSILVKAEKENKLILFSIGYASCHWCHVMEKETFQDKDVAKFMNANFINVKVDREEHPNIDKTYLKAVQMMTGNAGWPLNCVTLPNGKPVWGGTYFSKNEWMDSLEQIVKIYNESPDKTTQFAQKIAKDMQRLNTFSSDTIIDFSKVSLKKVRSQWEEKLDFLLGGENEEEKFPRPSTYNFLLRYADQEYDSVLFAYVHNTLKTIANSGLYDHVEGGFSRYSTDKAWRIPHFEKMLYTNAQLISSYSLAYQTQKNETYKNIVYETLDFIETHWLREDHLLFASLNADSVNPENKLEEGAYYLWEKEALEELLGDDFTLFIDYYNLYPTETSAEKHPNEKHVLMKRHEDAYFMEKHQLSKEEFYTKVKNWKALLLNERKKRNSPLKDTKVITAWNALMLKAYTDAYKSFGDEKIKIQAIQTATAIKNLLISEDWKVTRSLENNDIDGFLDDYAYLIDSFIGVYQITFDEQWLQYARSLTTYTMDHFYNTENDLFMFSDKNAKSLQFEEYDVEDGVIPSANSVMSHNLFQLGHYFGNDDLIQKSKQMLQRNIADINEYPYLYSHWLDLYLNYTNPYYEVVVCGENALEKAKKLQTVYLPNIVLCGSETESELPLLKNRFVEGKTLIYVCVNRTCKLPTENIEQALLLMK